MYPTDDIQSQVHTNVNVIDTWNEVECFFPMKPNTNIPAINVWNRVGKGIYKPEGSYGISLQDDDLCLDCDPKNYPPNRNVLDEWLKICPVKTRAVETPSGGWHIRYKKPPGIRIRKEQPNFPGVEFRSRNHCIAGPNSLRDQVMADGRHVKGVYRLHFGCAPVLLPQHILDTLEKVPDALEKGTENWALLELPKFEAICKAADSAAPGTDNTRGLAAFKLAAIGRDLNLAPEVSFVAMRDLWDWRNRPPLYESKLWIQVQHAYSYAKNAPGVKSPQAVFDPPKLQLLPDKPKTIDIMEYQHDEIKRTLFQEKLTPKLNRAGEVIGIENTQANVIFIMRHSKYWAGRVRYNQFADRIEIVGRPSWRQDQSNKDENLSELDFDYIQGWLSATPEYMLEVPLTRIKSACQTAAQPYHPVRDYLAKLKWDGVARLDTILPDTTGCEDSPYTRAVGKCMMISAIKRIYEPGCKQDYVPVLESEQGTKKSMWVQTLGGQWASTGELIPRDKDTYQTLRGKWFIELPEIDGTFSKTEFAWLKKTLSTATDNYRPSYAQHAQSIPRESIFIGTLNPSATGEYLRDTENRRFLPVATGKFNIELLEQNKDQYFAEAKARYDNKELSWIDDPEIAGIAKQEQAARREKDPWVEIIAGWAAAKQTFTGFEVYSMLGFTGHSLTSHARKRMYQALKDLGYQYTAGSHLWSKKKRTIEDLL